MKNSLLLLVAVVLYSCGSAKYKYSFQTGKQMDFSKGRWILNSSKSHSKVYDSKLYNISLREFKKILGDSLVELHELRRTQLVDPSIKFDLSEADLEELKRNTYCDYLINVRGERISDGAGTLSFPNQVDNTNNSASVTISIYDLNLKTLISSSQVIGKIEHQNALFDDDNNLPTINPSSQMIMLKGVEKLIRKYAREQLKYRPSEKVSIKM